MKYSKNEILFQYNFIKRNQRGIWGSLFYKPIKKHKFFHLMNQVTEIAVNKIIHFATYEELQYYLKVCQKIKTFGTSKSKCT